MDVVSTQPLYIPSKEELSEYIVFVPLWFWEDECSKVCDISTAVSRSALSHLCEREHNLSSLLLYSFSMFVANVEVHLIF